MYSITLQIEDSSGGRYHVGGNAMTYFSSGISEFYVYAEYSVFLLRDIMNFVFTPREVS